MVGTPHPRRLGRLLGGGLLVVALWAPASPSGAITSAHAFPVVGRVSFAATHAQYPATDIMAACGLTVVAPVTGRLLQVNRVNRWKRTVDDPATRGGRYLAILGDDGVRYYMAHLSTIRPGLRAGVRVRVGQHLATVGRTGRAGACHLHFALSPPCRTAGEWWVRRGVVSPYRFLRAWQRGTELSPVSTVRAWQRHHPRACTSPTAIGAT